MLRSIGPDSVMSCGHVRHKASPCYQSLLMSSAEGGCLGEEEREDEEEEGKAGCCCSTEHQLDAYIHWLGGNLSSDRA